MNAKLPKTIWTIDSHTDGEGTRLVTRGLPALRGKTMAQKMAYAASHLAWAPGRLLQEPRGHKDLYGAILTKACSPDADFGIVFMNNQGYEPMCGHGLIGAVTSLLETGILPSQEPLTQLTADTPLGLVKVEARIEQGRVRQVAFENAPSFAVLLDAALALEDGASLHVDVAFGGNFFLLVDCRRNGLSLSIENSSYLAGLGMRAIGAANQQFRLDHPFVESLNRITDLRYLADPVSPGINSRNLVVLGNHMLDRSPCGTGTCAEIAVQFARGQVRLGETLACESLLGGCFRATALREADWTPGLVPYPPIIARLEGRAFLTGMHRFVYREDDPYRDGFLFAGGA